MLMKASGKKAMGRTQSFKWFAKSMNGLTSAEGAECSEQPSIVRTDENVALVNELIQ
jgi:hypothetical protein